MNSFPDNKRFAFSILDDTDLSTVENTAPIYRLLTELGMRTTKDPASDPVLFDHAHAR